MCNVYTELKHILKKPYVKENQSARFGLKG